MSLLLLSVFLGCAHLPQPSTSKIGAPFPEVTFERDGKTRKLSEVKGVRVIDLWATWCGPCQLSMPHLEEVAELYGARGVQVLALSVDDSAATMELYLDGSEFDAIEFGWTGEGVLGAVGVDGIPATFVVDEGGQIVAEIMGYYPGDDRLEQALDLALVP